MNLLQMSLSASVLILIVIACRKFHTGGMKISDIQADRYSAAKPQDFKEIPSEVRPGLEPNFVCRALLSKDQAVQDDTREFVNRVFDGSVPLLFSSLLSQKALSKKELEELKRIINEME